MRGRGGVGKKGGRNIMDLSPVFGKERVRIAKKWRCRKKRREEHNGPFTSFWKRKGENSKKMGCPKLNSYSYSNYFTSIILFCSIFKFENTNNSSLILYLLR